MTEAVIDRLNAALEGRYRLERELGEGGMATVYLAEDLKHHRSVALKVLKPELAAVVGGERFLAEIETTANLNHPNILPLFDSGEADGFLFYVMPYVEGESLRERVQKEKQLPLDETVRVATEVAEALDHAHRHGVVHRDVKPANILLQEGRPLVADFGIALAVSAAGGGRLTETGLSLGTPYYMSPEQATGDREVDARSDTYALGCVVYEMLTGEPPYTGNTAQAVLGRILMGNVDAPTIHRKSIPPNVDGAVLKALEKLPADRFVRATDFARALQDPSFRHSTGGGDRAAVGAAGTGLGWGVVAATAVVVALAAGAVGWFVGRGAGESPTVERHRIVLGSGPEQIPEMVAFRAAVHPRDEGILFGDTTTVGGRSTVGIWWKGRDQLEPTRLTSMDGALSPTFSPGGDWILFVQDGELRKQPLRGGNSLTLAAPVAGGTAHALAWLDDGTIVFENSGFIIQRIPESGQGEPETLSTEEVTGQPIHMSGFPGSWGVLVSACVNSCPAGSKLSLLDLERDTIATLAENIVRAWPAPEDHILYLTRDGGVFAAELDRDRLTLGPPIPLFDGVRVSSDSNGEMQVGQRGTAVFVRGTAALGNFIPMGVDRSGRASLDYFGIASAPRGYTGLSLSPDGRRAAFSVNAPGGLQIWVGEKNGPLIPLTPDETSADRPVWTPDGNRIAYVSQSGPRHVRSLRADGTSNAPDTLVQGLASYEFAYVGQGDTVLVRSGNTNSGGTDVHLVDLAAGGEPVLLLDSPHSESSLAPSPDGNWLAYESNLSGRWEVYVRPFPDVSQGQTPISLNGGFEPVWSPDGDELFYRESSGWLIAARISTDPEFRVESRERLFDSSGYAWQSGWRAYDVLPGSDHFVMLQPGPGGVTEVGDLVLMDDLFQALDEARRP